MNGIIKVGFAICLLVAVTLGQFTAAPVRDHRPRSLSFDVQSVRGVVIIDFDEPVTRVNIDVHGGGTLTCFTARGLELGDELRGEGNLGIGAPDARIVSCEFTGGSFSNLVTK